MQIFLNLRSRILTAIGIRVWALTQIMVLLSCVWTSWQLTVPFPLDNRIQLVAELSPVEWPALWSFLLHIGLCKAAQAIFTGNHKPVCSAPKENWNNMGMSSSSQRHHLPVGAKYSAQQLLCLCCEIVQVDAAQVPCAGPCNSSLAHEAHRSG